MKIYCVHVGEKGVKSIKPARTRKEKYMKIEPE